MSGNVYVEQPSGDWPSEVKGVVKAAVSEAITVSINAIVSVAGKDKKANIRIFGRFAHYVDDLAVHAHAN
ncbi:hypothetical protein TYRP_020759 [Tyrophagus putrescentiae]|nr:hypothetical protein TYRP_020759 [Tyrophagus putrescentiae]